MPSQLVTVRLGICLYYCVEGMHRKDSGSPFAFLLIPAAFLFCTFLEGSKLLKIDTAHCVHLQAPTSTHKHHYTASQLVSSTASLVHCTTAPLHPLLRPYIQSEAVSSTAMTGWVCCLRTAEARWIGAPRRGLIELEPLRVKCFFFFWLMSSLAHLPTCPRQDLSR